MQKLVRRIGTGIAAGAFLTTVLAASAFADVTVDVSGNGAHSHNSVNVSISNTTEVKQSNSTHVTNDVSSSANTGGNTASGNTGGDVSIDTGHAASDVTVINHGSSNTANVQSCGCDFGNVDVTVEDNGAHSHNKVKVKLSDLLSVVQKNHSHVSTWVWSSAKTGKNKANDNTGGNVDVLTGDAHSTVEVHTFGASNDLNP